MHSIVTALTERARAQFYDNLNYLKMRELLQVCHHFGLPYRIMYKTSEGEIKKTSLADRKKILLKRLVHLMHQNQVLPQTVFPASVVRFKFPSLRLKSSDYVYYGEYKNGNATILKLMQGLRGV